MLLFAKYCCKTDLGVFCQSKAKPYLRKEFLKNTNKVHIIKNVENIISSISTLDLGIFSIKIKIVYNKKPSKTKTTKGVVILINIMERINNGINLKSLSEIRIIQYILKNVNGIKKEYIDMLFNVSEKNKGINPPNEDVIILAVLFLLISHAIK